MDFCKNCKSEVPFSYEKCPTCGQYMGPPNVRSAKSKKELDALNLRYEAALDDAKKNGSYKCLTEFDEEVKKSFTVINVDLNYLNLVCTSDNALYSNYFLQTNGQIRKPASEDHDKHRRGVDALLFGEYSKEIRYAALSLDGMGLISYGHYSMKLKEIAVKDRATLLENNSYEFAQKNNLKPGDIIPAGYKSCWNDRHKLAVSKLCKKVKADTKKNEFSKILLYADKKNRAKDEFIEVHIYGGFDNKAIESVTGKFVSKNKHEQALQNVIKELLQTSRILLVEL